MIENLKKNNVFQDCNAKMICSLIGGSTLYGLNNESSDVDYRGVFVATDKKFLSGLLTVDSIVTDGEIDSTYHEISRFIQLTRKSNTQVMEILFAPEEYFEYIDPIFDKVRANKFSLIDTDVLKSSLRGYVHSEYRLATGERTGRLGGKRKNALELHGFSPKNFVQILRLCRVGQIFFESGEYMVRVSDFDQDFHNLLMDIKNYPIKYDCEQLKAMVDEEFKKLNNIIDNSKVSFKFDIDLAADIILESRNL